MLREQVSERKYKNVCGKVIAHCTRIRDRVRKEKHNKLIHLVNKYGDNTSKVKPVLPVELKEFSKSEIFKILSFKFALHEA